MTATFGWFLAHRPSGNPILFKNGGQQGVANLLYVLPKEQLACVVLTNRSNGRALAQQVCNEVLSACLPDWQHPQETVDLPPLPLSVVQLPAEVQGAWTGMLTGGGAQLPVQLRLLPGEAATLTLGDQPAVPLHGLQREGTTYLAQATGLIPAVASRRAQAMALHLKLLPSGGQLVGRG